MRRSARHLAAATATVAALIGATVLSASSATADTPATGATPSAFTINAGQLSIGLTANGQVSSLVDTADGVNYVAAPHGQNAYLIQLAANGAQQLPTSVSFDHPSSTYTFDFGKIDTQVGIQVKSHRTYTTLDVTKVTKPADVDVATLLWGPIATNITKTVGESVGVVRDGSFAIGIHELNNKTVGGWPFEDDQYGYASDVVGANEWSSEWSSAYRATWGSALQAYTYDYTKTRYRTTGWPGAAQETDVPAPPLTGSDAAIPGSEIALFGTTPDGVLNVISSIETENGLPHPTIDGRWQKTSQADSQPFLVLSDLNSGNVAQASQYANEGGIGYIYSLPGADGPWVSAGHYQFNSSFGGSDAGMAAAVKTAAQYGVKIGVHTLSDFIDPNDPYVTPTPDPGLAKGGEASLTRPLSGSDTSIYVNSSTPFTNGGLGSLLQIGNEIASYSSVTQVGTTNEWVLSGVSRHIWGTTAAATEPVGTTVSRLVGNEYGGALGGLPLVNDLASRLSSMLNDTGVKAMSFDGAESASQTPYGLYSSAQMINGMYYGQSSHDGTITEASNIYPNTWDAQSRVSWGEAYNGTSMQQVYDNINFYERNYLPNMMGWLAFRPGNSTLQQQWQMAKAASWNAGTNLQTSVSALSSSGNTAEVLGDLKQWDEARDLGAFTQAQEAEMRPLSTYWNLVNVVPDQAWNLYPVDFPSSSQQANGGSTATWQYTNPYAGQSLRFQLQASGGTVTDPSFTIGGDTLTFDVNVPSGDYLVSNGTATATLYDSTWHQLSKVTATGSAKLSAGQQTVTYNSSGAKSNVWIIAQGAAQSVVAPDHAQSASVTASSFYQRYPGDTRYAPQNATDGLPGTSWASNGQSNPWIQLNWKTPQTISAMSFSNPTGGTGTVSSGTLTFSDGSTVKVSGIPNDGSSYTVTFPQRTVTSVKLQVTGGSGQNIGLQEIGAYGPPPQNFGALQPTDVARTATATASSSYQASPSDTRYQPGSVIDGLNGTEWASNGEKDPWLQLSWPTPQTISSITISDPTDGMGQASRGTLTFSDGATLAVNGIPHSGKPFVINFAPKLVTSVKFQITGGTGNNIGIQEIQALAPTDLAGSATATASSYYNDDSSNLRNVTYQPSQAIDGDPSSEWASQGELGPWIKLSWPTPQKISAMTFADRSNLTDWAPGGTLTFSDGTTITVKGIPNDGTPIQVTFPSKTVTWVKFQVTGGSGENVGLQEIQAFQ